MLSGVVMLLTVRSVQQPPSSGMEGMRGDLAEVVEAIHFRGWVRYHNVLWYARAHEPLDVGETVRIVGKRFESPGRKGVTRGGDTGRGDT